jgi:hypothetical protein
MGGILQRSIGIGYELHYKGLFSYGARGIFATNTRNAHQVMCTT